MSPADKPEIAGTGERMPPVNGGAAGVVGAMRAEVVAPDRNGAKAALGVVPACGEADVALPGAAAAMVWVGGRRVTAAPAPDTVPVTTTASTTTAAIRWRPHVLVAHTDACAGLGRPLGDRHRDSLRCELAMRGVPCRSRFCPTVAPEWSDRHPP
jgi:hypothetical protein